MSLITVSIVSHGHAALLPALLEDLSACPEVGEVILTRNIPEPDIGHPKPGWLRIIDNAEPRGFASNHNAAFRQVKTCYFAILNPDVRFMGNPFPALIACMESQNAALCAPAVVNPAGELEDSTRQFPTVATLLLKALGFHDGRLNYVLGDPPLRVPWVAGMFLLVRSSDYAAVGGFDEGFFLYYEDVDLCARLTEAGRPIMLCPGVRIVHDARRASRRDLQHMAWHAASMTRYFRKHFWRSYRQTAE